MSFWNTMDSYGEMVFVTIKFVGIRWDKMGKARCFVFFDCITHSYRCDICCFLNRWAGESCLMQQPKTHKMHQNAEKCPTRMFSGRLPQNFPGPPRVSNDSTTCNRGFSATLQLKVNRSTKSEFSWKKMVPPSSVGWFINTINYPLVK